MRQVTLQRTLHATSAPVTSLHCSLFLFLCFPIFVDADREEKTEPSQHFQCTLGRVLWRPCYKQRTKCCTYSAVTTATPEHKTYSVSFKIMSAYSAQRQLVVQRSHFLVRREGAFQTQSNCNACYTGTANHLFRCVRRTAREVMCPCGGTLASSSIFANTYPTIFPVGWGHSGMHQENDNE